jgi:pimeloyl-ACP methyl ester carboxylesterase
MLFLVILAPLPLPAQRQIVSVPFRSVNSYRLVEASIDGRPVTLLVDTGANKTILNARSIGRVQLTVSQPVNQGAGIVGNALRLRVHVWRRQMKAIASAGYRAIAPDMRGYGRSLAPADATLYTPLHTAGDLVGLLDALNIPSAIIVGHDWGASHAWNAALMRPDRFKAVFCMSVPYVPRGDVSVFERMRKSGHQNDFYMFEQMKPEADQIWADAAVTIPGVLYWASGSAPADKQWSPMDPARSLHRPAPGPLPSWAEPDYVAHNVTEFQRTGFHGGLNYYRAAEPYFYLSGAWKGAKITQPSFYIAGKADGLSRLYPLVEKLGVGLPGLVGTLEIDNVGHWVQHEASAEVNDQIVKFLRTVNPA